MGIQETLITLFIVVIVIGIVFGSYLAYVNIFKSQLAYNTLTTEMNRITAQSGKAIRGSSAVLDDHTIDLDTYTTSNATLVLQTPSIDDNGDIISNADDYLILTQPAGDQTYLYLITDPDPASSRTASAVPLTTHLNSIQFNYNTETYTDVEKVEMIITLAQDIGPRTVRVSGQTTARLRNF